jgi:hypothetical protein
MCDSLLCRLRRDHAAFVQRLYYLIVQRLLDLVGVVRPDNKLCHRITSFCVKQNRRSEDGRYVVSQ